MIALAISTMEIKLADLANPDDTQTKISFHLEDQRKWKLCMLLDVFIFLSNSVQSNQDLHPTLIGTSSWKLCEHACKDSSFRRPWASKLDILQRSLKGRLYLQDRPKSQRGSVRAGRYSKFLDLEKIPRGKKGFAHWNVLRLFFFSLQN